MTRFADSFAIWLSDFYLLSTALLVLALISITALRQPAQRLAITKATLVALALLAALCALPRWSIVHLLTAAEQTPSSALLPGEPRPLPIATTASANAAAPTKTVTTAPEAPFVADTATAAPPAEAWSLPAIRWTTAISILHLVGAASVVAWLVMGSIAARRLRLSARPAPGELKRLLSELNSSRDNHTARVELLTCGRIDVAVALGLRRPAILLPTRWLNESELQGNDLRSVLSHELAHIRHHDLYWLAASRLLMIALWAQPLFWLMRRRMRLDQESLADAAAAELTSRERYAEQLVAWARNIGNRPAVRIASAVGLWEGPSQLRQRIALLLNDRLNVIRECSVRWRTSSFLVCGIAALGLSLLTLQPGQSASQPEDGGAAANSVATSQGDLPAVPNTFTGRVVDEAGRPIEKASVYLFRVRHDGSQRRESAVKVADSSGRFQFDNVINIDTEFPNKKFPPLNEPGDNFVEVIVRANGRASTGRVLIPQVVGKVGEYQEFMLPAAAVLKGRVTGPDGEPVPNASVSLENGGIGPWEGASSGRTDTRGNYTITDAIPFDVDELEKQIDAAEAKRTLGEAPHVDELYASVPKLSVAHPDFATLVTRVKKSSGTTDAQLAAAATLEGRVVFANGKPASGATIGLATSYTINLGDPPPAVAPTIYKTSVVADANGKYRISSLPAGKYDLWADVPGWVNAGAVAVATKPGAPTAVPDLVAINGGLIRARLVDSGTNAPVPLGSGTRAQLIVEQLSRSAGRPTPNHQIEPNPNGLFEIRAVPGKPLLLIGGVEVNGAAKWYSEKPAIITVADGETKDVDVPVVDITSRAASLNQNANPQSPGTAPPANAPLPPTPPPPPPDAPAASDSNQGAASPAKPNSRPVEFGIVVARHVLLLDAKEIITWEGLDKKIGALSDPSNCTPQFYITRGAREGNGYETAKDQIWKLHSKYKLKGHSEGSLWPRADFRYDRIKDASDLKPDASLRMEGIVTNQQGKPIAGAEVVLVTPVDESISYKTVDIALVEGRLRNRLEEVVTDTDAQGRFVIYPPRLRGPEGPHYYVVAMHPAVGFGVFPELGDLFDPNMEPKNRNRLSLIPWAALVTALGPEGGAKQSVSIRSQMHKEWGNYPELEFTQYWSDLKRKEIANIFGFTHVPPMMDTSIRRDIEQPDGSSTGITAASVKMLSGESRQIDLGQLSDKQREQLKWQHDEFQKRLDESQKRAYEEKPAANDSAADKQSTENGSLEQAVSLKKIGQSWLTVPQDESSQQGRFLIEPRYASKADNADFDVAK